jgi:DNA-binding PadR family transcriptional regulator
MSAISTLGYALLGLLARQARTGYELARSLDAPLGNFWRAQHSQIYPELRRLLEAGLIEFEVVDGPGPRENKRYSLTGQGRIRLGTWVAEPPEPVPPRSELLLKVYSMWLADPAEAAALLRDQERLHAERLASYEAIERELIEQYGERLRDLTDPIACNYATLRCGLSFEQHSVSYIRWLLTTLEGTPAGAANSAMAAEPHGVQPGSPRP